MRAIESLSDCCSQRRVLRVLNNHCRPGERLKRDPMQTDCAAKREDRHEPASSAKHLHEGSERRYESQCGTIPMLLRLRSGRLHAASLPFPSKNAVTFVKINCRSNARNPQRLFPFTGRKFAWRFNCLIGGFRHRRGHVHRFRQNTSIQFFC